MRRSYANTALIRSGAQRFGAAAGEMRSHAQSVERKANTLTDGWRGKGADAYRTVAEHLRLDILQASSAFERAAGTLSMLASQLDQVNHLYRQCEQLEHQIHSLQAQLWGAEEDRRERLHDQISDLRHQLNQLEQQAEYTDRAANNAAGSQFEQIATMANNVYFATHEVGPQISAADKVGNFFKDLYDKAKDTYEDIAEEGGLLGGILGFFEGLISSVIDTLEGLWHLTPTYWVHKAISDPEGTKEKAAKIFHAITHPEEVWEDTKEFVTGIPQMAKVVWSTVMDSIDRDLIHGNAYTRSKWAGYAAGIIAETILTAGVGEAGQVVKGAERTADVVGDAMKAAKAVEKAVPDQLDEANVIGTTDDALPAETNLGPTSAGMSGTLSIDDVIKLYGQPHSLQNYLGKSFHEHADLYLETYGLTVQEFTRLRRKPNHVLTDEQAQLIKSVRDGLEMPRDGEFVQKVVTGDSIELYLNQSQYLGDPKQKDWTHQVGGFFAKIEDVAHIRTPDDLFKGLALNYEGTYFRMGSETVGALRFPIPEGRAEIPYGGNNAEGASKMGSEFVQKRPFTGNGFSNSKHHMVPEFMTDQKFDMPHLTELWEINTNGEERLRGIYDQDFGTFRRVDDDWKGDK